MENTGNSIDKILVLDNIIDYPDIEKYIGSNLYSSLKQVKWALEREAPLASELIEKFPQRIYYLGTYRQLCIIATSACYRISYFTECERLIRDVVAVREDKSLCNALAKCWLYLKENKLI